MAERGESHDVHALELKMPRIRCAALEHDVRLLDEERAEQLECADVIRRSARSLSAILDDIQVSSQPSKARTRKPAKRRAQAQQGDKGFKAASRLRLLLAEDNRINQFFLKDYFEAQGHAVDIAENGEIALEKLKARSYDLILMDIQMPRMDGLETTRIIRASGEPWSTIPIVALTAYALSHDRDKALQAGMDAYVPKPINFPELEREMAQALATRAAAPRGETPEPSGPTAASARGSSASPPASTDRGEIIKELFRGEVRMRRESVSAYLEAEDLDGLSDEAHGLRNGAHYAGAADIYTLATAMENAARQGRRDEALEVARSLLDELGKYLRVN